MKYSAAGGILGPIIFVAGWAILGLIHDDYSFLDNAISELARAETSTHVAMTLVFGAYAMGMLAFATALHKPLAKGVAIVNALATAAVGAFPLGAADDAHFVSAAIAYASLALLPIAMQRSATAITTTAAIAVALTISVVGPNDLNGLFQRVGLTIGDIWIVASSLQLMAAIGRRYESKKIAAITK